MAIKIENTSGLKLPKNTEIKLEKILESVPREHLIGLDRLRIVDRITDARLRLPNASELPGLYHPRQGTQKAWLEVAAGALLPSQKPFLKRLLPRLSFKANLAAVVFSLIGQHYHLTFKHSLKKGQLEAAVRAYTEKQIKQWNEREHQFRARLFKPLQPTLEKWSRSLQKKAAAEKKKSRGDLRG
jgi:hypothetical protein